MNEMVVIMCELLLFSEMVVMVLIMMFLYLIGVLLVLRFCVVLNVIVIFGLMDNYVCIIIDRLINVVMIGMS